MLNLKIFVKFCVGRHILVHGEVTNEITKDIDKKNCNAIIFKPHSLSFPLKNYRSIYNITLKTKQNKAYRNQINLTNISIHH